MYVRREVGADDDELCHAVMYAKSEFSNGGERRDVR